ncbi:putative helicase [Tupanvirus deep ocean]|uniref:Helicase n=2 Tax=Tupanvirus TaxID=2094720 RepID=A0AC62AAD4_9VIRU|nr:putative helicase [Tupanvirus deep ocean]QKU34647.1 putative helicase [Tupanvirus deep ocean]
MSLKVDKKADIVEHNNLKNADKKHTKTKSGSKTSNKPIKNNKDKKVVKKTSASKNDNFNELERLYNFMKKYKNESKKKSGKNLPWTHSMTYEPYGSYDIPDDMYPKFRKLYEDAIVAGYKPHITEKHKKYGPIVIDLDFVQSKENGKRYYTNNMIANIIKLYNKIIKKYLNVYNNCMDAYVSEKKEPTLRGGSYHDGLHIVYPYICTKPSLQMLMRQEFIKLAEEHNIFKRIPLINDLDNVFDKGVIYNVGWMMYGSRKNTSSGVYYVTHIYSTANGKVFDTLIPGEDISTRNYIKHFIDVLSCRRFFSENDITELADGVDPMDIDNELDKLKETLVEGNNKKEEITALMGEDINFIKAVSEETLVEAKNLVKLFSKERATNYHSWIQVGWCLHNVDYRLLGDWIEFSKKCPNKFKKGECEQLWKKMKSSSYTMATLHYFASKDNPEKYLKMKEERLNKLIQDGLEASHNTIAKLLMEKYKFIYRCASIKHNIWYEFKNHRWVEIDSAFSLRKLISDVLTIEYGKKQSYLYDLAKEKQHYDKEQCYNEAARISKVIKQLNNSTFKNGVIRECADIAYDPEFLKNLDENIYLICFENGVYDLQAENFRDGCPDDYISLCTGYKYMEYDKNDEYSKDIKSFLKKIQPDNVMRKYLMTLLSTCLAGSISEESFYVFTGSGANGKSKLMELMKYTLGDLFKPMDIMVLVGKRTSSSSATPELADKKGIRICPFDEPKATDEINTGFMKIFTGGDMITARALFKEPIYFKPQFKPFLLCNHLPNIKSDDEGTWRRLKVIPFLSKFVRAADATKTMKKNGLDASKGQFWADGNLSEKLPEWKQVFMGMLLKYYKKYKTGGLVHPKLVTQHTAEYRKRCDVFQDFIGDYLEKTGEAKDNINVTTLHEGMRSWYRANYEGKAPNTKELRNYLQHRMTTSYNSKTDSLTGFKLKTNDNEEATLDELTNLHK